MQIRGPLLFLLLLLLSSSVIAATSPKADEQEVILLRALLGSYPGQTVEKKTSILRRLTLYPASESNKQEVLLPRFAQWLLSSDENSVTRRELAKAIYAIKPSAGMQRGLIPLLKLENIGLPESIEAAQLTEDPLFAVPLLQLSAQAIDSKTRTISLKAGVKLWIPEKCDAGLPKNLKNGLKQLAGEQQYKAMLLLGCIGDTKTAVAQLSDRLKIGDENQRLTIIEFFSFYKDRSAMPVLLQVAQHDASKTVRLSALKVLTSMPAEKSKAPKTDSETLTTLYQQSQDLREKEWILQNIYQKPDGRSRIIAIDRHEKDQRLRDFMRELLQGKRSKPLPSPFQ